VRTLIADDVLGVQSDPRSFIVRKTADEVFKMYACKFSLVDLI